MPPVGGQVGDLLRGHDVTVAHPWARPLEPSGEQPAQAAARPLTAQGVAFRGGFQLTGIGPDAINGEKNGAAVPYDAAFIVLPHRPPTIVRQSGLAAPPGWMNVTFPELRHPDRPRVFGAGDLIDPVLRAGMAGTLGVFQGAYVADTILADR